MSGSAPDRLKMARQRCRAFPVQEMLGPSPSITLNNPQTPILPPPFLVIATTDGRTGMSGLKSGQRVERSS